MGEIKRFIVDDIDEVVILAIFNQDTINIPPYKDEEVNYSEVYFIHVTLRSEKHMERIAEIIERTIPNPSCIIFSCGDRISIAVAEKRLNKAESGKQVVEWCFRSPWVNVTAPSESEARFLDALNIKNFTFSDLRKWYSEFSSCVYQSVLLQFLADFHFNRKADILSLRSLVDAYQGSAREVAQLEKEENTTLHFGERVAVHQKKLKGLERLKEHKHNIEQFLSATK